MAVHLFVAPAGAGKTAYCIDRVRSACREQPVRPVWVCLPDRAQVAAFQRRLAAAGGALGAHAGTFYTLYGETLTAAGLAFAELGEAWQHRLLRAVVDQAAESGALQHYLPLRDKPGLILALQKLIGELKRGRVEPARLTGAVKGQGARLEELAGLYAAYQAWLLDQRWMDPEGLGWLAALALERQPDLFAGWALAVVDGFDQLNPTQISYLHALALQVPEVLITLTHGPGRGRVAQRRFEAALDSLEAGLAVRAEPLPEVPVVRAAGLVHLEAGLFQPSYPPADPGGAVSCLEAPNRPQEVRAALRWVKERLVVDGMEPREVAILARKMDLYALLLAETAREFGLPLELAGGLPVAGNPAVAALLALLSLPRRDRASASVQDGRFPLRQTLEALRSPYFDWQSCTVDGEPLDLSPQDVDRLEQAAQAGQVLAGPEQWREALALVPAPATDEDEEDGGAGRANGQRLAARFELFVGRLTPEPQDTVAGYIGFVEDLIGDDGDPASLHMLARLGTGPRDLAGRDRQALQALKDVLRDLAWAEAMLGRGLPVPYERYLDDLEGAIQAARYRPPAPAAGAVWAASAGEARGLSFRAVAILGLREGEFPAPPPAEPLLREGDRAWLASQGLPLAPEPPGGEITLFYEAVTRARERLLLSRPYLAEDGQPADPSPCWDEVLRVFAGDDKAARSRLVACVRSADALPPERAGSWPEWVAALSQALAGGQLSAGSVATALAQEPAAAPLWRRAVWGAEVLRARTERQPAGPFEGDCVELASALGVRWAPARPWSASRLESYLGCPMAFFLAHALELPERVEPAAGFDAAQLGSMYHEILEEVYRRAPGGQAEDLLAALPEVAQGVLEAAPRTYGFRPSQLWEQEKERIRSDCENTLRALAEIGQGWRPAGLELGFGRKEDEAGPQAIATDGQGRFLLRGVVDRIDANAAGELRLIDYKASGEAITARDLLEGRRVQLALYARVLQDGLGLGRVVDGFYWHLRAARRSALTLASIDGGAEAAMDWAARHAAQAIAGATTGRFPPQPRGEKGCPAYCLGKELCWRYAPGR